MTDTSPNEAPPPCARVIGLDVGSKTIGVAVSDELGLAAHPLKTLARAGTAADVNHIMALITAHQAGAVVVGLPLELSGAVGHRARRVRVLTEALRTRLGESIPVYEEDERFSTAAVERVLLEADLSRRRRKQVVDKQAAAYILQGWLDGRR